MAAFGGIYGGKRVLVTGHTGFKGSWLSLWLNSLGASVTGLSIDVPTTPSLFDLAGVQDIVHHRLCDVRSMEEVAAIVDATAPEFVFHLAAQSLVRRSYVDPIGTLETNVVGTANVLEAVRAADIQCSIVAVTSDKCYHNDGRAGGYRENDPMGGHDPYSMSKGAAELVIDSWRSSYFGGLSSKVRLGSTRAGNVIGGGDWSADRIVPDCIGALISGNPLSLRNPCSTRPWQHVLEPLSGYLWLGHHLHYDSFAARGWNFGPDPSNVRTVEDLSHEMIRNWGDGEVTFAGNADELSEAVHLSLEIDLARTHLRWHSVWAFERTVAETVRWYAAWNRRTEDMRGLTMSQIESYVQDAVSQELPWAQGCDGI